MATTKIKCPVEGIIDLDRLPGVPAERVVALVDAPELQRLRRVKQLGFTELVYPGATHTRFAHSLGAFQGAQRTLTQLRAQKVDLPDDWFAATALACLLHDLGHGPFSHTFERIVDQRHEERTEQIVRGGPRVPAALEDIGPGMGDKVIALLRHRVPEPRLAFLADLVSSALDCDRMDYLRRDALHTGAHYGAFDRDWLIREMMPTSEGDAMIVIEKGRTAVEQYLIGRYHMFQNVYLHKTSRGFEGAFRALCLRLRALGSEALPAGSRGFAVLFELPLSLESFLQVSDLNFQVEIETLVDHEDATVRGLARTLLGRRPLQQRTLTGEGLSEEQARAWMQERRADAVRAGLDPTTSVWEDAAEDVPYRPYAPAKGRPGLRIQRRDGSLVDVTELSPSLAALAQKIVVRRAYWLLAEDPARTR